jgi:pimeloyl-ACP methyl ester carboxylesterase
MTYVLILVHGTGSPDAAWTRDCSLLCSSLRTALENAGHAVVFERCVWSGRNGVRARQSAVVDLQRVIACSCRSYPNAVRCVIAHSHGGNIAIRALTAAPGAISGLVCMATPFLSTRRRPSSARLKALLPYVLAVATLGLWLCFDTKHPLLLSLFLFGVVGGSALILDWIEAQSTQTIGQLSKPYDSSVPLLILRAAGDEASMALATAQFVGWISGRLWRLPALLLNSLDGLYKRMPAFPGGQWAQPVWIILIFCALCWEIGNELLTNVPKWRQIADLLVIGPLLAFLALPLAIVPFLVTLSLLAVLLYIITSLAFSTELGLSSIFAEFRAEPCPAGNHELRLFAEPEDVDQLSVPHLGQFEAHAVYAHPGAVRDLVTWIAQRGSGRIDA